MDPRLLKTLKTYYGFDTFRPLQAEIITEALNGNDVLAILPTGAGKSLCFQIPSLVTEGLTLVVSPLIALMKNQVDLLESNGIPAAFLNSSQSAEESHSARTRVRSGEIRILYVSPERLALDDLTALSGGRRLDLIAIDEAHCVSEWGHDFRPEYRQLAELRERVAGVPMMALTATATERVRDDITSALKLRIQNPFVASFDRPNLNYRVSPKQRALEQIIRFLEARKNQSGIIYCQSRNAVERLSQKLRSQNINALPYHAGMEKDERSRHQEAFIRDDCQIICATIAFGMGIDKPNVRFVIHHDLPKNIESYYQETGRAGRDGLPSECLLLFSPGDAAKHHHFIDEKPSEQEREIARQQLQKLIHYAEHSECRHAALLEYFGETPQKSSCQACDNCLEPKSTFDGTVPAQKVLSCLYRIYQHSGFSVGATHVADILSGANTEKIRKWSHDKLSTYGIGTEFRKDGWNHVIRQLIRKGLIQQNEAAFNTLQLSPDGTEFLREKREIRLIQPPQRKAYRDSTPRSSGVSATAAPTEFDDDLFEELRRLRRELANERSVPAYVVFSDVTLRHIARSYPQSEGDLLNIPGIGAAKLAEYGALISSTVTKFLQTNPRREF